MVTISEIPLAPEAQRMTITLAGEVYRLTFLYREASMCGWIMDIADSRDNPIACGLPLVTGANILEQFWYLGLGGGMAVMTDGDDSVPTFRGLGSSSRLYWVTPE